MRNPHLPDRGAALVAVFVCEPGQPLSAVLVKDERWTDSRLKLTGGSIEDFDDSPEDGGAREARCETGGIPITPGHLKLIAVDTLWSRRARRTYQRYLFVAFVTPEMVQEVSHGADEWVGDEDGHPLRVKVVKLSEIQTMPDFLDAHRPCIEKIEAALREEPCACSQQ